MATLTTPIRRLEVNVDSVFGSSHHSANGTGDANPPHRTRSTLQ